MEQSSDRAVALRALLDQANADLRDHGHDGWVSGSTAAALAATALSPECGMAGDRNEAILHSYCRSSKDVPTPGAPLGPLLVRASCRCWCHGSTS